jgi:hypothetical protein
MDAKGRQDFPDTQGSINMAGESPGTPSFATAPQPNGWRRTVLTAGMAAALLVAGGAAVVSAASPDPSVSPTPVTTTDPSDGTTAPSTTSGEGTRANCHDATSGNPSATPSPTPAS